MSHTEVLSMDQKVMEKSFSPACGDFDTGVKALILEKKKPIWRFKCVEDVPSQFVEAFFQSKKQHDFSLA